MLHLNGQPLKAAKIYEEEDLIIPSMILRHCSFLQKPKKDLQKL